MWISCLAHPRLSTLGTGFSAGQSRNPGAFLAGVIPPPRLPRTIPLGRPDTDRKQTSSTWRGVRIPYHAPVKFPPAMRHELPRYAAFSLIGKSAVDCSSHFFVAPGSTMGDGIRQPPNAGLGSRRSSPGRRPLDQSARWKAKHACGSSPLSAPLEILTGLASQSPRSPLSAVSSRQQRRGLAASRDRQLGALTDQISARSPRIRSGGVGS